MPPSLHHRARPLLAAGATVTTALALTLSVPTTATAGAVPEPPPAPPGATLVLDPSSVAVGDVFTITISGCTREGVPQDMMQVHLLYDLDMSAGLYPTGPSGVVAITARASEDDVPELLIGAQCIDMSVDPGGEVVFRYETQRLEVVTTGGPYPIEPPTTPPAPPAPRVEGRPRFTG